MTDKSRKRDNAFASIDRKGLSPLGRDIINGLKEVYRDVAGHEALPARVVEVPDNVDVAAIRRGLGLSQDGFARRFGFSVRAIQQWEQRRRKPESAARAYLTVIARNPKAVEDALGAS